MSSAPLGPLPAEVEPNTYTVSYGITPQGGGSPPSELMITVQVMTPAPGPAKTVTMATYVTEQYAGPQIVSFNVSPTDTVGNVNSSPVTLAATIATADISRTASVVFTVSATA